MNIIEETANKLGVYIELDSVDNKFVMTWGDFVVNEWSEKFDNLSMLLLRLATLMKCGEENWDACFAIDLDDFIEVGHTFFERTVA